MDTSRCFLYRGVFDTDTSLSYKMQNNKNGLFVMVISGSFNVEDTILSPRDAIGIEDVESVELTSLSADSDILLIEVPMSF